MCTPRYEFRHGTSSAPRHCGSSVSPLPLFRSALARHHAFFFVFCRFSFFFSVWWWRARAGFSLREKLTEFKADSVLPKLFSGGKDLAKPRLIFSGGMWV